MQRRETLNAEHHGLLLYPHPFPIRDFVYETLHKASGRTAIIKCNIFHHDLQTETGRQALTEASTLKQRNRCEADTTSPATVDYNEQTKAVTPILRSGGLSSGKLNF